LTDINHDMIIICLAIVLSVLLQFNASDYPFGILKLFLRGHFQKLLFNCAHISILLHKMLISS